MPSIVIMNAKGGVDKSTLTMAFAETMATYQDARCLLIDADGQMSLSLMLADGMRLAQQSNNQLTIVPLFQQLVLDGFSSVDWRNFILQGVSDVDTAEKIHLLTGSMDLPLLEREIAARGRTIELRAAVRRFLDEAEQYFDLIIVDCAPGISIMTEVWLRECDHHIIPVKPDTLAMTGLRYLQSFQSRDPEKGFARLLGIVINLQLMNSVEDAIMERLIREDAALQTFRSSIPNVGHLQKAALFTSPDRSYVAKYPGDAGQAIRDVCMEIRTRLQLGND